MTKRILGAVLALTAVVGLTTAAGATASTPTPGPITVPGGLTPNETPGTTGDCELDNVVCRPPLAGSCSNTVTTTTPPSATTTIKVLIRTPNSDAVTISAMPFQNYVQNVLPNEWVPTWDGDARKAGAVAVKTYAWYWMSHFGGYVDGNQSTCFDVTDDTDFQKYKAGSALPATNSSIAQTWPVFARKNGQVFQTQYRQYFHSPNELCGSYRSSFPGQMSQYGTQNCNDTDLKLGGSTANKYNVILQLYYGSDLQLVTTRQLRAQHDFQYLQRSTRATFDAGRWGINDGYDTYLNFGTKGDVPQVNTVGDGFARVGVFRPKTHTFYFGTPTGGIARTIVFGAPTDVPVAAQYQNLTSPTQAAVFRPSNGTWYFATSGGGVASKLAFGQRGDVPVPGRWLSASKDTVAVFRPSTARWYLAGRSGSIQYGAKGDIPVPADYTGDGVTDIAVYRPSNHTFYLRGHAGVQWGVAGDVAVTGDFDGDGKADLAVYRPSNHTWYVRGISTTAFGATGATPIGKAPYAD